MSIEPDPPSERDPRADREPEYCSYEQFGVEFFEAAVTRRRVADGVDALAGQPIDVGPIGVGPGRLVKVRATGRIGAASIEEVPGDLIAYRAELPVSLDFAIALPLESHRFHAELRVPLVLTARAMVPATVRLEITPPSASDVGLDLTADGLRASVLQRVTGMEGEVRRFVATYVRREVTKPYVDRARTIDVAAAIDRAWAAVGLVPETARTVADDFEEAIESEIREHADDA